MISNLRSRHFFNNQSLLLGKKTWNEYEELADPYIILDGNAINDEEIMSNLRQRYELRNHPRFGFNVAAPKESINRQNKNIVKRKLRDIWNTSELDADISLGGNTERPSAPVTPNAADTRNVADLPNEDVNNADTPQSQPPSEDVNVPIDLPPSKAVNVVNEDVNVVNIRVESIEVEEPNENVSRVEAIEVEEPNENVSRVESIEVEVPPTEFIPQQSNDISMEDEHVEFNERKNIEADSKDLTSSSSQSSETRKKPVIKDVKIKSLKEEIKFKIENREKSASIPSVIEYEASPPTGRFSKKRLKKPLKKKAKLKHVMAEELDCVSINSKGLPAVFLCDDSRMKDMLDSYANIL